MSGQSQDHQETEYNQNNTATGKPFHELSPEAPCLANENGGMLRKLSLLQPNLRQTFLDSEIPTQR